MSTWPQSGLVPGVIGQQPKDTAQVTYSDGAVVSLGNELRPSQVQNAPSIQWKAKQNQLYTVIMTDPDAPSRQDPKFGEFMHWLTVDVVGADLSSGKVLVEYMGSAPPTGTGPALKNSELDE